MRLGIPYLGGPRWIAGDVYTTNLAVALGTLPTEDQPQIKLLLGPRRSRDAARRLRREFDTATFGYRNGHAAVRACASAGLSVAKGGSPLSLGLTARLSRLDVLFPVVTTLPASFSTPWMGWVPDYQCMHFPQYWPDRAYEKYTAELTQKVPFLVVSSEDARRDAREFCGRTQNVATLPFALVPTSTWSEADPNEIVRRYGLPERFVMFPSQFWRHKDHETLIRALSILRDRGRKVALVLTGHIEDTRDAGHARRVLNLLTDEAVTDQVHVLGLIPRSDVIALERQAVALVQPSRFEGWSALVEEARALGKRIVVSDLAVHREQQPPRARFFTPGDAEGLAAQLSAVWEEGSAGPDADLEPVARVEAAQRARQFARRFIDIAMEAIRAFTPA